MREIELATANLRRLDELAAQDSPIHRLHPVAKLVTTILFLIFVTSFGRLEISRLIPYALFPVMLLSLSGLPAGFIVRRVLLVEPLIIGIGILNPVLDRTLVPVAGFVVAQGWLTALSLFLRGTLTVLAAVLLIATTGMDRLAYAMRALKLPRIFVSQIFLTYRYISVLGEAVSRTTRAYSLRAPRQKGIIMKAWGSLSGQLILRAVDRAEKIYQAMLLRGYMGEYPVSHPSRLACRDLLFMVSWALFFLLARLVNLSAQLGLLFLGGIS
jgi:cobalt/nickel transport system permease protein